MRRGWWLAFVLAVAVWALFCVISLYRGLMEEADQITDYKSMLVEIPAETTGDTSSPVEDLEDSELYHMEAIEFYPVPMDHELQAHIIRTCNGYGIDPTIAIAMIDRESDFDISAIGDRGESYGLLQVKPRYHVERMEKLGVSDLLDPFDNVLVGIDYLAELLDKYDGDMEKALVGYNAGPSGAYEHYFSKGVYSSEYSRQVLATSKSLAEEVNTWEQTTY